MKIGFLGAGTWGTALAKLLASLNHKVIVWDRNPNTVKHLQESRVHPRLKDVKIPDNVFYTNVLEDAVKDVDMIVEAVTSLGIKTIL